MAHRQLPIRLKSTPTFTMGKKTFGELLSDANQYRQPDERDITIQAAKCPDRCCGSSIRDDRTGMWLQ